MAPQVTKQAVGNKWLKDFKNVVEMDGWGQREEARESYAGLAAIIANKTMGDETSTWTEREAVNAERMAICLRLRSDEIRRGGMHGISLANMKALVPVMEQLFRGGEKFPIDLKSVDDADLARAKTALCLPPKAGVSRGRCDAKTLQQRRQDVVETIIGSDDEDENDPHDRKGKGFLGSPDGARPADKPKPHSRSVGFQVGKIGFKDENLQLVDPTISAYVVAGGKVTGVQVDTSPAQKHQAKYFIFDEAIKMTQSLEAIAPGSAIVFEFKHFKKDKNKMSTKCWCFLEREDLKNGPAVLELYKKPVDPKRKKLSLFTVKPLYLHIDVEIGDGPHAGKLY
eukprot:CAMPEP_0174915632 /NCGR_PEP_ID=MMETSP1355-20121228/1232_1 /TAXON_ID=464990 /ORGANISM="Hemiselmis tepida, Strain CCMP443" /LENGTH=339 /DNA_ID=CAMNT_0016160549 /DNA_START=42 /DNA_END=1061 /DNA_ORIENTATION=+